MTTPIWAVLAGGAASGAIVTLASSAWTDTRRARREAEALFAQQRRECYAAFLITTSAYVQAIIPRETRDEKLIKGAEQELWTTLAQILLLGDDTVKRAAEEYAKVLTRVLGKGKPLENSESKRLREVFIAAARADLPDHRR